MVDLVSGGPVCMTFDLGETLAGKAGVVLNEAGPTHQQVQHEAGELHADWDEEEDDGALLLVFDQELGEDATQGYDDARSTCMQQTARWIRESLIRDWSLF